MMRKTSRLAAGMLSAAALSLAATPAMARDWGWGGGWGGRHHHDRVDAGDVITGILIIGGIAAIASAASNNNNKKRRYERREEPYPDERYERDYSRDDRPQWQEGSGINGAINRCMSEVSRGSNQSAEVDQVSRDGDGWRVEGRSSGGEFSCTIDRDGRIRNVNVGGRAI